MYEVMICLSMKYSDKQFCLEEKSEDTKGVIRSRKSKDRKCNGQMKKDKGTNNELQNITLKIQ